MTVMAMVLSTIAQRSGSRGWLMCASQVGSQIQGR